MTKEQAAEWLRDHSEWLKQWGWGEYGEQVVKAADLLGTTNPAITEAIAAERERCATVAETIIGGSYAGVAHRTAKRIAAAIRKDPTP